MSVRQSRSETEVESTSQSLTLWRAVKDLGFISWLFAALVGAPSIVSLVQTVFVDFQLTNLLQWLLNGYNDLLGIITIVLVPIADSVLSVVESLIDIPLELRPHWQPLFILLAIFISSNTRSLMDDGYSKPALIFVVVMLVAALAGAWTAGVISASAPWWVQGIAVGLPIFMLFAGMFVSYSISWLLFGFSQPYRKPLAAYLMRGLSLALTAFFITGLISLTGLIDGHAGLLTLFAGMSVYGSYWIHEGFAQGEIPEIRFGLRLVGGFAFAAAILGLNIVLRLIP